MGNSELFHTITFWRSLMHFIIKALLAGFWLLLIPTASGALFLRKNRDFTIGESFLAGYLFSFSAAEILTLLLMYLNIPLHILVLCYGAVMLLTAATGVFFIKKQGFSHWLPSAKKIRSTSVFFWIAILLVVLQVFVVVKYAHYDADDALYVGAATTAIQEDSIFRINAYTGIPYNRLPRRYILSPFPIYLAVISELCGGLHAAITAHTVFPAVFLPAVYLVLYQLGKKWFSKGKDTQGIFLCIAVILCWFSAYSAYNAGNFQMVRLWQGKAVLAAFMIPLILYLSLTIVFEKKPAYPWLLYGMANLGACLLSSTGIILAPIIMGLFTVIGAIRFKSIKQMFAGLACCIPSVILGITYVLILVLRNKGII